jgi:geranylgeranyl diphosphate synthase type II
MKELQELKEQFEKYLYGQIPDKSPENLYLPIKYILKNGGKRIRPLLVLLATKTFDEDINKALPAAAAIETFHNFTLIHDDIMDKALIRRGKPTVHQKWDENIAILSGDTMLVWAYKMLENYDAEIYKNLSALLNQTAIEVCEGQQMDIDFENRKEVSIDEYIKMIRLKTAVLLGTSLQFGAIVSRAGNENMKLFYDFGVQLGLAFQIQDDYLDVYGETTHFGKKIGGDIIDRKKTFLYINALQKANQNDKNRLSYLYDNQEVNNDELIDEVMMFYEKYHIARLTKKQINSYTTAALQALDLMTISNQEKSFWKEFALYLMHRSK